MEDRITIIEELIDHVIFWEKHTEIHTSLQQIINESFGVKVKELKDVKEYPHTKDLIDLFISQQIDFKDLEKYKDLTAEIDEKFIITRK